ncbi:hypothetical protein, partial [Methylogaea oryzae]|uniref:hypothetical protein n=1 Tax=Methylogaea oryzae TaxID=1295382 RepID=UPI0020D12168
IAVAGQNQLYRLGDICRVQRGPEEPAAFKMKAMGDDAIGLAVSAAPGSDAIELGRRLNDTIDAVRAACHRTRKSACSPTSPRWCKNPPTS